MGLYQSIYVGAFAECKMEKRVFKIKSGKKCGDCGKYYPSLAKFCLSCGKEVVDNFQEKEEMVGFDERWDILEDYNDSLLSIIGIKENIIYFVSNRDTKPKTRLYIDSQDTTFTSITSSRMKLMKNAFEKIFCKEIEKMKEIYKLVEIKTGIIVEWF